jgi:hypothetical protein
MGEIRALSVRQPWAWAIACAGKDVENRTRGTRYRGLLTIHASKTVYREDMENPLILEAIAGTDFVIDEGPSSLGAIVAVAELVSCHLSPDFNGTCGATRPLCSPWAVRDQYHWCLASVRPLAEPVPCRGALGLWRLPDEVAARVDAVLGAFDGAPGHG